MVLLALFAVGPSINSAQAQWDNHWYLTGDECGQAVIAHSRGDYDYVRAVFGYPYYYGSTFGYGARAERYGDRTVNCGGAHQGYRYRPEGGMGWLSCGYRATIQERADGVEIVTAWTRFRECVGS